MRRYASLVCGCAALLAVIRPATAASGEARPGPAEAAIGEVDPADIAEEPEGGAGVSPIELVPRLELRQSFLQLGKGVSVHDSTAEMDIQFLRRVLLRYQIPFRVMETPNGQISGVGDVQLGAIAILASNAKSLFGLVGGAVLNTATQPQLGAGKQQVFFGAGAALKPRRWWLAYAVVQEQLSVAGDSARANVNQLAADVGSILFGKQYNWLKLDLNPTVDFPSGATGRLYGVLETGSLVVGRVGLFVRAGTQLAGPRQLDYSVAAGVRYLFKLEKGKPAPQ